MPVSYIDGKIYEFVNDVNPIVYVGSTAQQYLSQRKTGHVYDSKDITNTCPLYTAMRAIGAEHFTMRLIHAHPCNSKEELESEEYRVLDAIIASGKPVYNSTINRKMSNEARQKLIKARRGVAIKFGCLVRRTDKRGQYPRWMFKWSDLQGTHSMSFSVSKFGDYGAKFRAEELRRQIYPEWGNDEDILCDDFGEIEWD